MNSYANSLHIREAHEKDVEGIVRLANVGGPEGVAREAIPAILPESYRKIFQEIKKDTRSLLMVAEREGVVRIFKWRPCM